jgi:hypothetical protein
MTAAWTAYLDTGTKRRRGETWWQAYTRLRRSYKDAMDRIYQIRMQPGWRSGRGAERLFKRYLPTHIYEHPRQATVLFRPKQPLGAAAKQYVHRQLSYGVPAYYGGAAGTGAGLRKVLAPTLTRKVKAAAKLLRVCKKHNAQHCGSMPAKILKGLGLAPARQGTLPVELFTNQNLRVAGIAGYGAKRRLLQGLRSAARGRTAVGVAAATILAALGAGTVYVGRHAVQRREEIKPGLQRLMAKIRGK